MIREWTRGAFVISTDPRRLDLDAVHRFLVRSYWAEEIPRDVMERSIAASLPFGLYEQAEQVGFARVLTDWAVFAVLMDVFVLERCRGQGLGTWLVEVATSLPELDGSGASCWLPRTRTSSTGASDSTSRRGPISSWSASTRRPASIVGDGERGRSLTCNAALVTERAFHPRRSRA